MKILERDLDKYRLCHAILRVDGEYFQAGNRVSKLDDSSRTIEHILIRRGSAHITVGGLNVLMVIPVSKILAYYFEV